MVPWFKSVLTKLYSNKSEAKQFTHIEDSESVAIDAAALRCPVCLSIYSNVPLNLTCGHTFCTSCLDSIVRREENHPSVRFADKVFQCPICREKCNLRTAVRNFLVRDLLDSVAEIADSDVSKKLIYATNNRLTVERMKIKNTELEASLNRLRMSIHDSKQREKFNYIAIVFLLLIYVTINSLLN